MFHYSGQSVARHSVYTLYRNVRGVNVDCGKHLGPVGQRGKDNESSRAFIRTIHRTSLLGLSIKASGMLR